VICDSANQPLISNIFYIMNDRTVFYGEYMCTGPGSHKAKRVAHTQDIDNKEASQFLTLGYIKGSKWLLPPPAY